MLIFTHLANEFGLMAPKTAVRLERANLHFSPSWENQARLFVAEFARIRVKHPNSGEFGYEQSGLVFQAW